MEDHDPTNPGPGVQEPPALPTTPAQQPPIPGLLELRELTINKGQITLVEEKLIQRTISDMFYILNKGVHSPQFLNAARNVAGLMFYHSCKKDKALKLWRETVKCDPQNLNALQDLATAYRKLRNNREAVECERKIKEFLENATNDDRRLMMARCQLEQACAQFWDLHTESWTGVEKRKKQVESYEAGLNFAGELYDETLHQWEKRDWLLYTAQAHERLSHVFFRMEDNAGYLKAICTATEILHIVLQTCEQTDVKHTVPQKCEQTDVFQAEVWYVMGNMFARNEGSLQSEASPPKIVAEYKKEWNDPSLCYEKALQCDPNNVWILGRMGIYWFKKGNSYESAIKFLNKSIAAADKQGGDNHMRTSCWNALCHRAKIRIKEVKQIEKAKDKKKYEQSSDLLKQAKEDSSRAVEYNFNPFTLAVDGEVHYLLARHPHTSVEDAEELRNTALQRFYESSVCQDGQSISNTHLKWADCLMDKQDLPSAIESYKVAFETAHDTNGGYKTYIASQLLHAMLQNFKSEKKPGHLLKELAFWFTHIYRHCQPTRFNFDRLLWKNASEVLDVMECLVCKTSLPSEDKNLHKEMIQPALEDFDKLLKKPQFKTKLQQLNCTGFDSRLKGIIQENEKKINNCAVMPKSPEAVSPRGHHQPPERPIAEGVEYDFCVIYDTDNKTVEGWVEFSLLSGLECPFYGLKGCFDKRDFLPGRLKLKEAWTPALTQSAYILIILTHKMNKTSTLLKEISQIIEGKKIIVIQRQTTEVPPDLRIYRKFDFTVQPDIPELARYLMPQNYLYS